MALALLLGGFCCRLDAALPPIIDRNALFGEVQIANAEISPDGRYLAFLKPYKGARNIWVKKVDEPFSAARPVSAETQRPIPEYFWSRDGKYILYVQDQGAMRTSTSTRSTRRRRRRPDPGCRRRATSRMPPACAPRYMRCRRTSRTSCISD